MTIHAEHPFANPHRDDVRAFRGRLAAGVSLWTAHGARRPAGLTVTSLLVANGEPARLLALLDPLAELTEAMQHSGRAAVSLLAADQRRLAEVFADQLPAPGEKFSGFAATDWGPVPQETPTWAGVRLESAIEVGWSLLVTCTVERLSLGSEAEPLVHYRGGYPRLT